MTTATKTQEHSNAAAYQRSLKELPAPVETIDQEKYDVVIIGAGPAGLFSGSALARFGWNVLVVDNRSEPTIAGRADGVQPRTIEVLKNMAPIGQEMTTRGARCYERTFWDPPKSGERSIERIRRVQSCPLHYDSEDAYTLGVQQGLIERAFLRDMDRHGLRITRAWQFVNFELQTSAGYQSPVSITLKNVKTNEEKVVRAKYMIGCDGGRSAVRNVMSRDYGVEMKGNWVDTLWGAIDAVVHTDFPDIRKIAAIHSRDHGAIMIFPRETNDDGKDVVRLYTQINKKDGPEQDVQGGVKLKAGDVKVEDIMEADRKIFHPYKLEFEEIEWWTAYPIGQRIASKYSIEERVFIAGDACHTHSPKQGQGLNTSMMDAMNLSFKLHLVLSGLAQPSLLKSYEDERWPVGKYLVDFDAQFSALFSGEVPKNDIHGVGKMTKEERAEFFVKVQRENAEFTSGLGVNYGENKLNWISKTGEIGSKLVAGQRLDAGSVTRFINGEPVRIIHEVQFNSPGGFRIYVLTGSLEKNHNKLRSLAKGLLQPQSFINRYHGKVMAGMEGLPGLSPQAAQKSPFNPFFAFLLVVKQNRFRFELSDLDDFSPMNRYVYADDHQLGGDKIGDLEGDASVGGLHKKWGLDDGAVVVVRPDGYVGLVVRLDELSVVEKYFEGFLKETAMGAKL